MAYENIFQGRLVLFNTTEKKIREEMQSLGSGISLIVVAHRISSVMNLDEILYLNNGRIIERGTHSELIRLKGRYCELYNMQINPEKVIN